MNTRLEKFYKDTVVPKLMQEFGYDNVMQVPRISKISLNMGVGEAVGNKKILENAVAAIKNGASDFFTKPWNNDKPRRNSERFRSVSPT